MDQRLTFAYSWILWSLPLVLAALAAFLHFSWRRRQELTRRFVKSRLLASLTVGVSARRQFLRMGLCLLAAAFLIAALARPQYGTREEEARQQGLDIVVAIDTSKSMLAIDLAPNRLERAKLAALDLMSQARGDRLGLVAFAGTAFLQCPLTLDANAFRQNVMALDPGIIPQGGTALAQAVETSLEALEESGGSFRAIVLITDGEDHEEGAMEAARKAAGKDCRIFAVGVGTPEGELLSSVGEDGSASFLKDRQGNVIKSRLNQSLLEEMARATGGFYVSLQDSTSIGALYQSGLAPLPREEVASRLFKQPIDRFQWPLALALACLLAEPLISDRRKVRRPRGPVRSASVIRE